MWDHLRSPKERPNFKLCFSHRWWWPHTSRPWFLSITTLSSWPTATPKPSRRSWTWRSASCRLWFSDRFHRPTWSIRLSVNLALCKGLFILCFCILTIFFCGGGGRTCVSRVWSAVSRAACWSSSGRGYPPRPQEATAAPPCPSAPPPLSRSPPASASWRSSSRRGCDRAARGRPGRKRKLNVVTKMNLDLRWSNFLTCNGSTRHELLYFFFFLTTLLSECRIVTVAHSHLHSEDLKLMLEVYFQDANRLTLL